MGGSGLSRGQHYKIKENIMRPISQAKKRKLDQAKRKDVLIRALKTF